MKIFYGWWVLLGIFLVYTANNGILIHTLPLFYPELINEFGWDAEQVTRPASQFFIVAALITPFMGVLFDRYPTKRIMVLGITALVVALLFYPTVNSLDELTIVYLVFAFGLAGAGLVPNMLILTRWFKRYRGIAVGILLMGSSVGGAVFPLVVKETLVNQGWREAIMMIAIIGSVMMVAALFLVRNYPADMGLTVDDDTFPGTGSHETNAVTTTGPALRQVIKMPVFYILAFITGALWFCIVGMLQHQSIYISKDLGVDLAKLPAIFSVFFWCAIIGKLLFGYLSDIFNKMLIMLCAVMSLLIGLICLRFSSADNEIMLYGYAVICGVGFSGAFSMIQLILAEYFSGASFGKILALFTTVDSIAGSMGIKYLGHARVAQESYLPAFNNLISLCVISAILIIGLMFTKKKKAAVPA